jgi:hypothetical protein
MKGHVLIEITAGALAAMTPAQLAALQDNVVAAGLWEQVEGPVRVSGGDYLGVELPGLFVGIETDGYTHS